MLVLQILTLLAGAASASELLAKRAVPVPATTDPCGATCNSTYQLIVGCASNPDPMCECKTLASISASCSQCLQKTNSTVAGFLNYDYIRSSIAGCSCNIPACLKIGITAKFCLLADPLGATCSCPAFLQTGSQCSQCLRGVDPYVANLYDQQYIPGCQLVQGIIANITGTSPTTCQCPPSAASGSSSGSMSSSKPSAAAASASGAGSMSSSKPSMAASGSAVSSPSGVKTFTSAADKRHLSIGLALIAFSMVVFV